jgi:predicted Zn-dependent protease
MPPNRWKRAGAALALALVALSGCATVPYTNRSQFIMMSEADDLRLGAAAYQQVLSKERVTRDPRLTEPVQRVGRRIAAAADKPDYQWEFVVIDDPAQANAFCLPGGKVAVYTGIFPIAQDEGGLATVIGHEVAHALARHGAERMSTGMALQAAGVAVAIAAGGQSAATQQAVMSAYGLGAQVGVALPFSRSQESEADRIGLILMAKAGYDPEAALGLWQRMAQHAGGKGPPTWLSTHPTEGTRLQDIRTWIAEARQYFRPPPAPDAPLPSIGGTGGGSSPGAGADEPKFRPR